MTRFFFDATPPSSIRKTFFRQGVVNKKINKLGSVFLLLPNYHMLLLLLPACTCGQKKRARVGACAAEGQTRRLADAKEEEAKTADKPVPMSPINRTHLKSDDVIAVLSIGSYC